MKKEMSTNCISSHSTTSFKHVNDSNELLELVQEAERAIVQRRFREALNVSMTVLQKSRVEDDHLFLNNKSVQTGRLHFIVDEQNHRISPSSTDNIIIRIHAVPADLTYTDRAAAIALQSCYEMRREVTNDEEAINQENSILNLIAFVYQANSVQQRKMPLDLVVILLQFFCCSNTHKEESIAVSAITCAELLHFVLKSNDISEVTNSCAEIFSLFFFRIIPFLEPTTVKWLLMEATNNQSFEEYRTWSRTTNLRASSIRLAIQFIAEVAAHRKENCPLKKYLECCNTKFNSLLVECSNETKESSLSLVLHETNTGTRSSHRHLALAALQYLQKNLIGPLCHSEQRWENRIYTAAIVWIAFATWRKRKYILQALTAPIREIIEALGDN